MKHLPAITHVSVCLSLIMAVMNEAFTGAEIGIAAYCRIAYTPMSAQIVCQSIFIH